MSTDKPGAKSAAPRRTMLRQQLLALAFASGLAIATHVLLTSLFGVSSTTSSRIVGIYYLLLVLALSPHLVYELLPNRARAWVSRRIKFESSLDAVSRLSTDSHDDPKAPDLSVYPGRASRRDKVSAPVAFLIAALLTASFLIPGATFLLLLVAAVLAVTLSIVSSRRWVKLREHSLEIAGHELLERDSGGTIVGRIDLERPFTYEYLDKSTGFAIYQLRQGDQRLAFTSEAQLAGPIVRDLLRTQWPPMDRLSL